MCSLLCCWHVLVVVWGKSLLSKVNDDRLQYVIGCGCRNKCMLGKIKLFFVKGMTVQIQE
jgi:hypothetical protein